MRFAALFIFSTVLLSSHATFLPASVLPAADSYYGYGLGSSSYGALNQALKYPVHVILRSSAPYALPAAAPASYALPAAASAYALPAAAPATYALPASSAAISYALPATSSVPYALPAALSASDKSWKSMDKGGKALDKGVKVLDRGYPLNQPETYEIVVEGSNGIGFPDASSNAAGVYSGAILKYIPGIGLVAKYDYPLKK